MKKTFLKIFLFSFLFISVQQVLAQGPPEPPSNPSAGGNEVVGGGAPIGNGLTLLLSLGALYVFRKYYHLRSKVSLEE
ncbi:MAG: hypothetical protein PHX54_01275 [Lentimicrobiaceae bacterium]|jgi:hypothetical protein|nr:hypothetical protein [Lentimicrobiaceae bacterium]